MATTTVSTSSSSSSSTYTMVSSDYPSNTFTRLVCYASGGTSTKFTCQLPLPNQFVYQASFSWDEDNLPLAAQSIINNLTNTSNIQGRPELSEEALPTMLTDIGKQIGASMGKMLMNTASGALTGSTAAAKYLTQTAFGATYNPNKQLFFNGLGLREFMVSFDIVPQSSSQATQCANAIKQMRVAASPSYSESHAFFNYPCYFAMDGVVNGTTIFQYNKFAIRNIATNLTPGGMMAWHSDGKPVAYSLEIQGIEAVVSTQDVEENRKFLGV